MHKQSVLVLQYSVYIQSYGYVGPKLSVPMYERNWKLL